jgi:hypothetical protein
LVLFESFAGDIARWRSGLLLEKRKESVPDGPPYPARILFYAA